MSTAALPTLNAALNALAAVCLFAGWRAIRVRKDRALHLRWMLAALVFSTLFLCAYLAYHALHGSTPYPGRGLLRGVYFFILLTHIPLAAVVVPFSIAAVVLAWRDRLVMHRRIVRWLWPVWMYVSATGVLIYLMLHVL
jgi:putative membrane protein